MFYATLMPDDDWWSELWPDPEKVLRAVGIKPEMQVVDLCCGSGHFTKPMCELIQSGRVWALDLDEGLLAQAEKKCVNNANFHPILGDACQLCQQIDEPVDFIFIANTFHGIPDKTDFSKSINLSLKRNGHFAVINWHCYPREKTVVLEQPRGPDTELRMRHEEVQSAVEPAGFKMFKVIDVGPYHYAAIFTKL